MKILAIDDDMFILELYKEILNQENFELNISEDAFSAIIKFNEFKPDLLILDVDMPAGGGKKVFDRIRNTFMSQIPILFCTANPENIVEELKSSKTALLKKPFTKEILLDAINNLMNT